MFNFARWVCGFLVATSFCSEKYPESIDSKNNSSTDSTSLNFNQDALTTSTESLYFDFQDTKVMLDVAPNNESAISGLNLKHILIFPKTDSPATNSSLATQTFLNLTETELKHAWFGLQNFTQGFLTYSFYNQTSLYLAHHRSMLVVLYLTLFCLIFAIIALVFLFIKICFKKQNQEFAAIKKRRIFRTPTKAKRSIKRICETDERCYLLVPNAEEDEEEINY